MLAMAYTAYKPAERGYSVSYVAGEVNHCPGCGRSHWWVRSMTAECAFCATAVPLRDSNRG